MKIALNQKSMLILAASFITCFFAIGIPYWSLAYSQVSLPDTLYGLGLLLVFVLSVAICVTASAGIRSTITTMTFSVLSVVMARVIFDTSVDPTTHNLWPLEIVIAGYVAVVVTVAGVLLGSLLRWVVRRLAARGRT